MKREATLSIPGATRRPAFRFNVGFEGARLEPGDLLVLASGQNGIAVLRRGVPIARVPAALSERLLRLWNGGHALAVVERAGAKFCKIRVRFYPRRTA